MKKSFLFKFTFLFFCFFMLISCRKQEISLCFSKDTFEYGETINFNAFLDCEDYAIIEHNYNSMCLGNQKVHFLLKDKEGNEKDAYYVFTVVDTKAPEIILKEKKITIDYNSKFDAKTNVKSCVDPVDGNVSFSIVGDVDTSKAGEYTLTIIAVDQNENKREEAFVVVVKEEEKKTSSTTSKVESSTNTSSVPSSSSNSGNNNESTPSSGSETSSGKNNTNNNSNQNDSSISKEPQVCTPGKWTQLGNSGFVSYDYEEAWDFADNNTPEGYGAAVLSLYDECGKEGWTVHWFELSE